MKDEEGKVVKSKLDETRLREIAQAAEGFYLHLDNGPQTMQKLFNDGLSKMKVADINARLSRRPIERYEWPLAAAILFFCLALLINDRKRAANEVASSRRAGRGRTSYLHSLGRVMRLPLASTYTSSRNFRKPTSISSRP